MFTKEQQEVINKFPIFIPEPVRTNYFRNVFALKPEAIAFLKSNAVKSKDFIDKSFNWGLTSEGHVYWSKINVIYHRVSNLLDEPGISKQFINAGIPVELASPKANVTYSVTPSYRDWETKTDRKSTRLNSSHRSLSRMPSSA